MLPVILVLSHTLTNAREKKTPICVTDFWNCQNNLSEFCSHSTAGVQEESVENNLVFIHWSFYSIFLPEKITYLILLRMLYQADYTPHCSLKGAKSTFCYPDFKTDKERKMLCNLAKI